MAISWLALSLTDRCQLRCQHCLRDPGKQAVDLPLALIERVLDQAQRDYGTRHVALTGGEPTLHPQLAAVLEAIVARGFTWHLVTNGQRFKARLLDLLDARPPLRQALTAIDFSVEGATAAVHDRIRGAGTFHAAMEAVTLAHLRGLPFVLQLTVQALNVDQIEAFALMASHLGASRVSFGMAQPTGTDFDREMYLSPARWRSALDDITRMADCVRIPVSSAHGFPTTQAFQCCEPYRSEILNVDAHGRLTLCCQLSGGPGADGDEVLADLAVTPLPEAHQRMLDRIHALQSARNAAIAACTLDEGWDMFACNDCMRRCGKAHWVEGGAAGPRADRPRGRARPPAVETSDDPPR
jgi:MoaA/NifB/PqqE/SkfB family radical SAM enzyme